MGNSKNGFNSFYPFWLNRHYFFFRSYFFQKPNLQCSLPYRKNQIYNALCLIVTLSALGGIFALLNAPFIAVVQIIIYAGAIMVLFVFVIMTINLKKGLPPERKKWPAQLAIIIGIIPSASPAGTPANLGELLFSTFIYPFEITSVLIVAALVGAIVLGKKRNQE